MKRILNNVSINYSSKLSEVILDIPKITLDLNSNMALVEFNHSIPLHIPNQIDTSVQIEIGTIELPIPQQLLDVIINFYEEYTATKYGYEAV
jgi:hypothetical protein